MLVRQKSSTKWRYRGNDIADRRNRRQGLKSERSRNIQRAVTITSELGHRKKDVEHLVKE